MKPSYLLKHLLGTFVFYALLFLGAGTINYRQGLVYLAIGLVMFVLSYTVFRIDKELLEERSKPGKGGKPWDKAVLGLTFFTTVGMYLVAGLDSGRHHWSPEFHPAWYVLGGVLTVTGQILFLAAQKQNKFFSSTVRIQTEREHKVCDTGLYSLVRHPAYMGSIIQVIGFPMLMGSRWSILPVTILVILFIIRTHLEDLTLKNELTGYREYAAKTRFRIIPYIW